MNKIPGLMGDSSNRAVLSAFMLGLLVRHETSGIIDIIPSSLVNVP